MRFPGGLRADHGPCPQNSGSKTIVWSEPERVTPGTWLADRHPGWILGGRGGGLLDLGNDDARRWLTDHIDHMITEQGIDLYRQDFNMDPLDFWRHNDVPYRQGITEIRDVCGYLAYWDELRRRHPNMLIDSCASGGRRNDLETLRRAVPLLRSDEHGEPTAEQCHTYWHRPVDALLRHRQRLAMDAYTVRSHYCPHLTIGYDMRNRDLDYATARRLTEEWRRLPRLTLSATIILLRLTASTATSGSPGSLIAPSRATACSLPPPGRRRPDDAVEAPRARSHGGLRTDEFGTTARKTEMKGSELEDVGLGCRKQNEAESGGDFVGEKKR